MKYGTQKYALILAVFILAFSVSPAGGFDRESGCVKCHSDKERLAAMGFPQLYLDPAEVDREVNMSGAPTCVDCHKGNKNAMDMEQAHEGMPRPFYAAIGKNHKYQAVDRSIVNYDPIQPKGKNRATLLIRKPDAEKAKELGIKRIIQLHYHDRDPETIAYSPKIANETCGKCHEAETSTYNRSGMGLNKYQRGFSSFKKSPPGPQNCGAWWEDNYELIRNESTAEFSSTMSDGLARGCNKCHAGCNDCHYQGFKESGARHLFSKDMETLSCYGSGKGTICHAGPMDRRRGAGYLREEFAFPFGELRTDVHAEKGLPCSACHKLSGHSHGNLASEEARQSCANCHSEIVQALQESEHAQVDCSSCHIKAVGAYQFTFWGPGKSEGLFNVLTKHKEYYGTRSMPTLVRHPERGVWIPVKPYPMGVMNIKGKIKKTKLMLRTIPETVVEGNTARGEPETFTVSRDAVDVNDMYVITGSPRLKKNGIMLAWIQMDKMSHSLGKGRECESCHLSHDQVATSWFTYNNTNDIVSPFSGSYTVRATKKGLFFSGLDHTDILPVEGRDIEDFAPFVTASLKNWNVKGIDLSIPFSEKTYEKRRNDLNLFYAQLHHLKTKHKGDEKKQDELARINAMSYHNLDKAKKLLKEFK